MSPPLEMFARVATYPRSPVEGVVTNPLVQQQVGSGVQYAAQGFNGHQYARHGNVLLPGHATSNAAALSLAPKVVPATSSETGDGTTGATATAEGPGHHFSAAPKTSTECAQTLGPSAREQALELKVNELEALLQQKDALIKELRASLAKAGTKLPGGAQNSGPTQKEAAETRPSVRYAAAEPEDPIDIRLEEFYNTTGSAIQFRRINRGFYRFGETICEVNIINTKLMARTEDGWNRGKFGPIEKFLVYYENIERQKAGIMPEA